jgi:hypothetical protein
LFSTFTLKIPNSHLSHSRCIKILLPSSYFRRSKNSFIHLSIPHSLTQHFLYLLHVSALPNPHSYPSSKMVSKQQLNELEADSFSEISISKLCSVFSCWLWTACSLFFWEQGSYSRRIQWTHIPGNLDVSRIIWKLVKNWLPNVIFVLSNNAFIFYKKDQTRKSCIFL